MKKLVSLALIISILACNFSVLTVTGTSVAPQEQATGLVKKVSEPATITSESVIDKLKRGLRETLVGCSVLATIILPCYATYKVSCKLGSVLGYINKNKTLKTTLITGAAVGTTAFGFKMYYDHEFRCKVLERSLGCVLMAAVFPFYGPDYLSDKFRSFYSKFI